MTFEILWIVSMVFFCIIEAATSGLVSIWFAGGSLAALFCSLFGADIYVQIGVFLAVSALLLIALRKIALKSFKTKNIKTNSDRLIGEEVIITETVDNKQRIGKAKINDIEWKVKSETGEIINAGEYAKVNGIEGVKLIVTK